ncbi:MAG: hypothetical protein RMJ57_03440 [Bacteroidia bacterium]|nr:hypothetical protein [Bacteroidia bacterium]
MRKFIFLQMYAVFAQGVVSPVAYLPSSLISQGYKVVAELSRGGSGPTIPFYAKEPWELLRKVYVPSSPVLLYAEGVVGRLSVYQNKRLLWRGETTAVAIPLLGKGVHEIRIRGEKGGIIGGIYLLAQSDTQTWTTETYPERILFCKEPNSSLPPEKWGEIGFLSRTQGLCIAYGALPPARVQVALKKNQHAISLSLNAPAVPPRKGLSKSTFVLLFTSLALLAALFPEIRLSLWTGIFFPKAAGLSEALLSILWITSGILAISLAIPDLTIFWVFGVFLLVELILFEQLLGWGQWVWQSWLLPVMVLSIVGLLWSQYLFEALIGLWVIRALASILQFPQIAYLCSAEAFFSILLLST